MHQQNVATCAVASLYCFGLAKSAVAGFSKTSLMFSFLKMLSPPYAVTKCDVATGRPAFKGRLSPALYPLRPAMQKTSQIYVTRWQKFRPKSSKGAAEKKSWPKEFVAEFWLILPEKGPQKIFKRISLFLAVITTYNVHQDKIKFDC
jgi:hypothetical protein